MIVAKISQSESGMNDTDHFDHWPANMNNRQEREVKCSFLITVQIS